MQQQDKEIRITRCPTAYAAPSTGRISEDHSRALKAHHDELDALRASQDARQPIIYGKKARTKNWGPFDFRIDVVDELPDSMALHD